MISYNAGISDQLVNILCYESSLSTRILTFKRHMSDFSSRVSTESEPCTHNALEKDLARMSIINFLSIYLSILSHVEISPYRSAFVTASWFGLNSHAILNQCEFTVIRLK